MLSYDRIRRFHRFTDEQIDDFVEELNEFAIITAGNIRVDVIKDDPTKADLMQEVVRILTILQFA
ncbi:hypothetical protein MBAV_005409 [Candidatus Magnetobacterium bavaricum]|uniref:Uncharacterized protein n=1 Tax=Candidatus Magnetobacterium bavaricum TaxID=29290 RepID=A0A0F3GKI8_9BACT|nr:hypothetical protein MBAV_005409 [Candidatus Magnetobacterium bavaricum]